MLGIRDYFRKQGLPPGAVVGLSGGIDSAVTAHLASARRWDPSGCSASRCRVPSRRTTARPTRWRWGGTSASRCDASTSGPIYEAYLARLFRGLLGEQRRLRAGAAEHPVPHPGRAADGGVERGEPPRARDGQQERAVGRLLHALRRHRRRPRRARRRLQARRLRAGAARQRGRASGSPPNTIEKPPSAELAPDQLDSDDLPDYDVLDAILAQAIEGGANADDGRRRRRAPARPDRSRRHRPPRPQRVQATPVARWSCARHRRPSAPAAASRSSTAIGNEARRLTCRYPTQPARASRAKSNL